VNCGLTLLSGKRRIETHKRVKGLDLQPARGFRSRGQTACAMRSFSGLKPSSTPKFSDKRMTQVGIVKQGHAPAFEQPVLASRRGGGGGEGGGGGGGARGFGNRSDTDMPRPQTRSATAAPRGRLSTRVSPTRFRPTVEASGRAASIWARVASSKGRSVKSSGAGSVVASHSPNAPTGRNRPHNPLVFTIRREGKALFIRPEVVITRAAWPELCRWFVFRAPAFYRLLPNPI